MLRLTFCVFIKKKINIDKFVNSTRHAEKTSIESVEQPHTLLLELRAEPYGLGAYFTYAPFCIRGTCIRLPAPMPGMPGGDERGD